MTYPTCPECGSGRWSKPVHGDDYSCFGCGSTWTRPDEEINLANHPHPVKPPISEGMTWVKCDTCDCFIHEPCGKKNCTCDNDRRARRSPSRSGVDSAERSEVASPDNEKSRAGTRRPTEGHMPTATKSKSKTKATKKASTTKAQDKRSDAAARRGRGELEAQVKEVTDAYEADPSSVDLPEGKNLTPHLIAKLVGEKSGEDAPSSGAVAAILNRWNEYGFALLHDKPLAFKRYSAAGKKQGLDALKEKHREAKKAERAAAKAEKNS